MKTTIQRGVYTGKTAAPVPNRHEAAISARDAAPIGVPDGRHESRVEQTNGDAGTGRGMLFVV